MIHKQQKEEEIKDPTAFKEQIKIALHWIFRWPMMFLDRRGRK